jgi:AcrR family transcriptional regulator
MPSQILTLKKLKPKRRTAGTRAGMDRTKILGAARSLWLSDGPKGCSIRAVASHLGVGPTTIHAHFHGGVGELKDELARAALAERAPPYKPGQDPGDYLRRLFDSFLTTCRQEPHLASLVVLGLSKDPLFSPVFAERLCATVAAIAKKRPLAVALQLVLSRLVGIIIIETGEAAFLNPAIAKEKIMKVIDSLPAAEFPTLKVLGERLAAGAEARSGTGYEQKTAYAAADILIGELSKAR